MATRKLVSDSGRDFVQADSYYNDGHWMVSVNIEGAQVFKLEAQNHGSSGFAGRQWEVLRGADIYRMSGQQYGSLREILEDALVAGRQEFNIGQEIKAMMEEPKVKTFTVTLTAEEAFTLRQMAKQGQANTKSSLVTAAALNNQTMVKFFLEQEANEAAVMSKLDFVAEFNPED